MEKPKIAQPSPYGIEMKPGKYWWCACGLSSEQPLCDGSHKGTGFRPVRLILEEPRTVWFCGCKQTGTPPLCDGSHNKLK